MKMMSLRIGKIGVITNDKILIVVPIRNTQQH